jgi:hypothetical protein
MIEIEVLRNGKRVGRERSPAEIRESVVEQLGRIRGK